MGKNLTTAEFISKARLIHGDKYDYSLVEYIDRRTKVIIICPIHGAFLQTPDRHLSNNGCPKCSIQSRVSKRTFTKEEFIAKAREIHKDKYDYSKVEYINCMTKVCIICPIHGETYQTPSNHLRSCGCQMCYHEKHKKLVCGVGVNDLSYCPKHIYQKWISMLKRCYDKKFHARHPSYINCTVCKEWLTLSNFMNWFNQNYIEGYELDKDILVKGNKVYSPQTCCFVPDVINTALIRREKGKYGVGIGVYRHNKYVCSFSRGGNKVHLGCFKTKEEAHIAYKSAKEKYIKELAVSYFNKGEITEMVYQALMKYEVDIVD